MSPCYRYTHSRSIDQRDLVFHLCQQHLPHRQYHPIEKFHFQIPNHDFVLEMPFVKTENNSKNSINLIPC